MFKTFKYECKNQVWGEGLGLKLLNGDLHLFSANHFAKSEPVLTCCVTLDAVFPSPLFVKVCN